MTIMGTTWCTSLQDIMESRLAEHSYDEHATEEGHLQRRIACSYIMV